MRKFLVQRILWLIPMMVIILAVMFAIIHSLPDSPWSAYGRMDQNARATLDRRYGLDKPLAVQFANYVIGGKSPEGSFICGLICGNLGQSLRQRGTVQMILFNTGLDKPLKQSKFGYSIRLGFYAFLFAFGLGIPLGITSAIRQNTTFDYVVKFISSIALAVPSFILGLVLIMILANGLNLIVILPTSWSKAPPEVWIVPAFVLGFNTFASVIKLTRNSMLEVINQDYVRTARAKGLSERIVVKVHMLRNTLIPLVTYAGPALVELITGAFIIETMFGVPGMGREYVRSVVDKDYSLVLGLTVVYALLMTVANIIVDATYAFLDPRIRVGNE
jgi:oligopeptide transport system permease protein